MQTSNGQYLISTDLKKRGWTETLIRRYLNPPASTRPHRRYHGAPPIRLYSPVRVHSIEQSEDWTLIMARTDAWRLRAQKAATNKLNKLMAVVQEVEFIVPKLPMSELVDLACDHYNTRRYARGDWDFENASSVSDIAFVERVTVNYLRHCQSRYDDELPMMRSQVGRREMYLEINRKVYEAISTVYPTLAAECARQLAGKSSPEYLEWQQNAAMACAESIQR